jgi:hypothetical protein
MTEKVAKLVIGDQTHEFPVLSGSVGPDVIDIRSLYSKTGLFTYDPGFTSTAACDSAITYIDGDEGQLLYRGYPIEQLAEKSNYLEVCYLLLYGELPGKDEFAKFEELVTRHTMVHDQMQYFYRGFRRDAHPMAIITGVVGAMAAFYHDSTDINDPQQREIASIRMIAKIPTLAAMAYKYSVPALRLSAQRPRLRLQFPAYVLLGAGRGIQGRSPHRPGHGPDFYPSCRSRAERLDLDGAPVRLLRCQSLRLHCRGRGVPLGSGAWRGQ